MEYRQLTADHIPEVADFFVQAFSAPPWSEQWTIETASKRLQACLLYTSYRSGDSEYLINGKSCRLKDIYNLFVDSGITADSFSMVGQGRIHELVNMKPEERRNLIDEAAGIVRYRNRKKEAVRKLENTQRNLERVADVIGELADRLGRCV